MLDRHQKLIHKYLDDFYNCSKNKDINGFYYTSRLHSVIVLEIALASLEGSSFISFEYLCKKIPKNIGRRTSIQTILSNGVKAGYFLKHITPKDQRIKYYLLEAYSLKLMNKWLQEREMPSSI